jgi:hypothetical protein
LSATLFLSDGVTWMPPSWVYDLVLERLADAVEPEDAALAEGLRAGLSELTGGFSGLDELSTDPFRRVVTAADGVLERTQDVGPEGFSTAARFEEFMYALSEFKALLRVDSRAGPPPTSGTFVLSDAASWSADGWIFDLALEHLSAGARPTESLVSGMLLFARRPPERSVSVAMFSAPRFHALLPGAEYLAVRYGDGEGRSASAPSFYAALAEPTRELAAAILNDPRARR